MHGPARSQPPADAPTLVLLHSSASSARQWEALAAALRDRFHVHALDLHGHGARPDWAGATPLALADEAALLAPLLAAAGSAHLIGHSYGGAVALKAATLYPARVRSVTAFEPVLFRLLDGAADPGAAPAVAEVRSVARDLHAQLARGHADRAAQRFVDFWSGEGAWQSMPPARRQAVATRMPAVARHFDALFGDPLSAADLQRLGVPLLLLTGDRTAEPTRHIGALLRQALPHAQHLTLHGAGHMAPLTEPARVNAHIAAFLDAAAARRHAWQRRAKPAPQALAA